MRRNVLAQSIRHASISRQARRATSSRSSSTATATILPNTRLEPPLSPQRNTVDPFKLLLPELVYVRESITELVGAAHPSLTDIAAYYFALPGKQLRPLLVLLFASATNGISTGYLAKTTAPENVPIGPARWKLDLPLTSPYILNDWNHRTPDHDASFTAPFCISGPSSFLHHAAPPPTSTTPTKPPRLPPTSTILPTQIRLAQISEMMHVASLLHDDVLDKAETRRSSPSAPFQFGNKLSVLGGDFVLGRTSIALARLGDLEVVELVSTVLTNLIEGEVMQMRDADKMDAQSGVAVMPGAIETLTEKTWTTYLRKSYFKTAALMAKSARAAVVLGGAKSPADEYMKDVAYAYGRNIGIAFQLVDDALDFSSSSDLGKPGFGADLKLGLATAPTLYAWEEHPEMGELVGRRFKGPGDVETARDLVLRSNALERTRLLARQYTDKALEALDLLPHSEARDALAALAEKVVERSR